MAESSVLDSYLALVTLRGIRRYIVRSHAVMMTVFLGIVYALIALSESGMLVLAHLGGGYTTLLVSSPGTGPGFLILAPWGVLALPIFGVIAMAIVTVGVALGMSVAILLAVAVARRRSPHAGAPATLGSLTGLTPAMIALLALGACCSTTAAATAGVGVIAQVTGSTTVQLLQNNWFLSIFQLGIVWIALLAQEALLRVYGELYGLPAEATGSRTPSPSPRLDRRAIAGGAFRAGLLIAGVTWTLAIFADWTVVAPGAASAATWADWLVVHLLLGGTAVAVALFPTAAARFFDRFARSLGVRVVRGALLAGGLLLTIGAPPPLAASGLEGWGNELLALAGAPASWGAVSPIYGWGFALAFRWGLQYLFLGAFAIALALRPGSVLRLARWSTGTDRAPETDARSDADAGRFVPG